MSHYRVTYRIDVEASSLGAVAELVIYKARRTFPEGSFLDVEKQKEGLWLSMMPDWVKEILQGGDDQEIDAAKRELQALERRRHFRAV